MKNGRQKKALYLFGILPALWLALLCAPFFFGGLPSIIEGLPMAIAKPFHIIIVEDTGRCVLLFLAGYGIFVAVHASSQKNYRRREEHGSAKWGEARALGRKYAAKSILENKILTENVRIGLDGRRHRRNLNTIVVGGSGAGKTQFYAKPNIMQRNTSFVTLDPKGEILRDTGALLEADGYVIKVLDLINMEKSHCYNPFVYLKSDNDIQRLATNLFKNTAPKGSQSQDPFWDNAAMMLLLALMFYLYYEAPEDEQNFPMVMEMIRAGDVREDMEDYLSPLDELFAILEARNPQSLPANTMADISLCETGRLLKGFDEAFVASQPQHIALKYYRNYRSGSAKTLKSIQITLVTRLEKFNLTSLASIVQTDELELWSLGEQKTALFAVIPDNDSSFNFIVGMLYTQLFQQLYYQADYVHGGRLPIPVHFLMDEFANVALPDEFDKLLSTMRGREIFVSIILQNLAQLKALYEKQWESIVGNCDEFLYLGGNEQSTHEYVSKLLGKATIDTNTYGQSKGRNGNYSINAQQAGRELLTPDEVRMLDNRFAILFVRGEQPVMDEKYDTFRRIKQLGATHYEHARDTLSFATVRLDMEAIMQSAATDSNIENDYDILSNEELEEEYSQHNTTGGYPL